MGSRLVNCWIYPWSSSFACFYITQSIYSFYHSIIDFYCSNVDGRRDGNGAHTEEMAMWDLLPIRSSLKVSEEQEEEGRVWMAEEMEMVFTLKKWRCGTYCQSDPALRLKSGKNEVSELNIQSWSRQDGWTSPCRCSDHTSPLTDVNHSHLHGGTPKIEGENVVH